MSSTALVVIISVIVGIVIGILFGKRFSQAHKQKIQLEKELKETKQKLQEQHDRVSEHFTKTAALLHDMTTSYQAVYEHIAEDAKSICSDNPATGRLYDSPDAKFLQQDTEVNAPNKPQLTEPAQNGDAPQKAEPHPHKTNKAELDDMDEDKEIQPPKDYAAN